MKQAVPGLAWVVGILLSTAATGLTFAVVLLVIGLRPGRTPSARRPSWGCRLMVAPFLSR